MGPIWIFSPIQSSTPGPRASLKIALAHEFFFELPVLAFIKQRLLLLVTSLYGQQLWVDGRVQLFLIGFLGRLLLVWFVI